MFSLSGRPSRNPATSSQSLGEMNYSGAGLIQNFFTQGMKLIWVQQLGLVHIGKHEKFLRNLFSKDGYLESQRATQTNKEMKFHLIL